MFYTLYGNYGSARSLIMLCTLNDGQRHYVKIRCGRHNTWGNLVSENARGVAVCETDIKAQAATVPGAS